MKGIKMTLGQMQWLTRQLENGRNHGNMSGVVYISIQSHPNGRKYIQFEQPCIYPECSGSYYRYDEEIKERELEL